MIYDDDLPHFHPDLDDDLVSMGGDGWGNAWPSPGSCSGTRHGPASRPQTGETLFFRMERALFLVVPWYMMKVLPLVGSSSLD